MKKTDKFLIGIVLGIVALVVVAFLVAMNKPKTVYQPEDTPEGVAFNYLFALEQKDYERAYSYLSPKLAGYPKNAEDFADNVQDYSWNFRNLENGASSFEIISVDTIGQRVDVEVQVNNFYQNGLFDSGQYTDTFDITLYQDQNGKWKITESDAYWVWCWDDRDGCN